MNWNLPKPGSHRIIKKFAWLPKKLDSPQNKMVWLESYSEEQFFDHYDNWNKTLRWQGERPKYHPSLLSGMINKAPGTPDEQARDEIKSILQGSPEKDDSIE